MVRNKKKTNTNNDTNNGLKKLKRGDLLEMLIKLSKENEELENQLNEARNELSKRDININKAGSISEAALQLNDALTSAQNDIVQYLENIMQLSYHQEEISTQITGESEEKAAQLILHTQEKCGARWRRVKRKKEIREQGSWS